MKIAIMITGFLLFALAGAVLYVWGLRRQMSKTQDLMNLLFSTGVSRVNKYIKKNTCISQEQAEKLVTGMKVKLPFSSEKAAVTDSKDFSRQLLSYMVKTGQLVTDGKLYMPPCNKRK